MDCIFCKIVKGEIPCYKIYEDKNYLAFLDIADDVEGHTLVVPKKHADDVNSCSANNFAGLMKTAQMLCQHYERLGYDGTNILINCKKAAGQEVGHLHVHVFPRRKNDNVKLSPVCEKKSRNLARLAEKLKVN